jgi:hypothetical protein
MLASLFIKSRIMRASSMIVTLLGVPDAHGSHLIPQDEAVESIDLVVNVAE